MEQMKLFDKVKKINVLMSDLEDSPMEDLASACGEIYAEDIELAAKFNSKLRKFYINFLLKNTP